MAIHAPIRLNMSLLFKIQIVFACSQFHCCEISRNGFGFCARPPDTRTSNGDRRNSNGFPNIDCFPVQDDWEVLDTQSEGTALLSNQCRRHRQKPKQCARGCKEVSRNQKGLEEASHPGARQGSLRRHVPRETIRREMRRNVLQRKDVWVCCPKS